MNGAPRDSLNSSSAQAATQKADCLAKGNTTITLVCTVVMAIATGFLAYFTCESVKQTDIMLAAENRPDLLIKYAPHPDKTSHGGISITNGGKGPASLLVIAMEGAPKPFCLNLNGTYVPVGGEVGRNDGRLISIIQEMINQRSQAQKEWQFGHKAEVFYLVYADIFGNAYRQEFVYQDNNPVPIWQKGCFSIGRIGPSDRCRSRFAKKLLLRSLRVEGKRCSGLFR